MNLQILSEMCKNGNCPFSGVKFECPGKCTEMTPDIGKERVMNNSIQVLEVSGQKDFLNMYNHRFLWGTNAVFNQFCPFEYHVELSKNELRPLESIRKYLYKTGATYFKIEQSLTESQIKGLENRLLFTKNELPEIGVPK